MDYDVRRSRRARHVWLRFSASGELVVTVPWRFDLRILPDVIASRQAWIERTAARLALQREHDSQTRAAALPHTVHLAATGQSFTVQYRETDSLRLTAVERPGGILLVRGAISDGESCRAALMRWLKRSARRTLLPLLVDTAGNAGLVVGRGIVRSQRTRWASCSRTGTISLNVRLMFVSPVLVRHTILHELCHTVHMDHSPAFWQLLERHDAGWREHRRMLRTAWSETPAWVARVPISRR